MKLKNVLISIMAILGLFCAKTVVADTTAPGSFYVSGSDFHVIYASKYLNGSTISTHYKQTTDGTVIYCTEIDDPVVDKENLKYTLSGEAGSRFTYILANGYPNKSITGDKDKDYLITSFSIWYLIEPTNSVFANFDISKGTYRGSYSDFVAEMAKLINGSKNYVQSNPTLKLNGESGFTLSSDKKYYVSSKLSVTSTGNASTYSVNLNNAPSGTIVTDSNGNAKNTFKTNEGFYVKVPASSIKSLNTEFSVSVNTTNTVYKAYLYVPAENKYQNVTTLYKDTINLNSSLALKINLTTEVQISKTDATTGKELPGAKLVVKDAKGNVKDSWVSTMTPHVIKGLEPGKYTLTEEYAPEGYVLSKETITFEVKLDGTVTKVVMKNEPTTVQISKTDATTGKELPGAKLVVKDAKGNVKDSWVSTDKPHVIRGLAPGKYTLTEEYAPEGYVLSKETITFEVKNDATVVKVVMENRPEEKKSVLISKRDITTGEELPGAHLELHDENGKLIEAWISTDEAHEIKGLEPGKYYLTEILAPEGYELSKEKIEFTVKEDGTVDGEIIMYNKPETIVEVPSTSSFKTMAASLIGIIVIGLGSMIIYRSYKKNEEI